VSRFVKGGALAALLAAAAMLAVVAHSALSPSSERSASWREAESLARRADSTKALMPALALRRRALERLESLSRVGPPAERSHAALLVGLLRLENAGQDKGNGQTHLEAAVEAFQRAVRLDPENDAAAYDLELLLSRSKADGRPLGLARPEQRTRPRSGPPGTDPAGSGY
jgi:tetratricopeptide (TPR) repeat protein